MRGKNVGLDCNKERKAERVSTLLSSDLQFYFVSQPEERLVISHAATITRQMSGWVFVVNAEHRNASIVVVYSYFDTARYQSPGCVSVLSNSEKDLRRNAYR